MCRKCTQFSGLVALFFPGLGGLAASGVRPGWANHSADLGGSGTKYEMQLEPLKSFALEEVCERKP